MSGDADHGARRLVLMHGREQARRMVEPDRRALVDIAAEVLADDAGRIGITYTGFCLTGLPHRRLPENEPWQRRGHRVTLLVEPGHLQRGPKEAPRLYGVPYGARARMILLYLQTQAVRTGSREVELGRSMRDWLGRMGLAWGGETGKALREQATRIAACSLKFFWEDDGDRGWKAGRFVSAGLAFQIAGAASDPRQAPLFEERVTLDESFWRALCDHPVPLREAALRELAAKSVSLDLYVWLAYRLHTLKMPTAVRWAALREQFGPDYDRPSHFKRDFLRALAPAVAAYPEAQVELGEDALLLHPSRPPVAPRLVAMAARS
jgi:hypothetical protein